MGRLHDFRSAIMAGSSTSRNLRDGRTSNDLQPKTAKEFPSLFLGNDRTLEPGRVGELKAAEIGAAQVGPFKAGVRHVRLSQAATGQYGVSEIGFAEIGALKVNAVQLPSSERQTTQIRVDQQTSLERRRHERVRDRHLGARQLAILEEGGRYDCAAPFRVLSEHADSIKDSI